MDEAVKTIITLLGAGGLTTVILGVLGFLKGRPVEPKPSGVPMFAALYADQPSIDRMSKAIDRLADGFERGSKAVERLADGADRQTDAVKDNTEAQRDRTRELRRRQS